MSDTNELKGVGVSAQQTLVAKLNPARFTAMSGKMAAIVGYILGVKFTTPSLSELVV